MQFTITQEHIDHGVKNNSLANPIALAINESLRDEFFIRMGCSVLGVFSKNATVNLALVWVELPTDIKDWYAKYGLGLKCGPTTFDLRISAEFLKPIK
jgi:hypothetical protein